MKGPCMERTGNVLKLDSAELGDLLQLLKTDLSPRFIHVDLRAMNVEQSFSRIALHNSVFREAIVTMAQSAYYAYAQRGSVTSFVHESRLDGLWNPLKDGTYRRAEDGTVYKLEEPLQTPTRPRLLVLFSSMPPDLFTPSLSRYFTTNFNSIAKFSNKETYILRIADVGGVIGNFYLDTLALPKNTQNIGTLIRDMMAQNGVQPEDVVLLGSSKGGTGALYHGVSLGLKFVAVDPILSDAHYWNKHNDIHFTNNSLFPRRKDEIFTQLLAQNDIDGAEEGTQCVIYSRRSPQHKYIHDQFLSLTDNGIFIDVDSPEIKDHPDVAPNALHVTTTIATTMLAGVGLKNGRSIVK